MKNKLYVGTKDGRVFVTSAKDVDSAFLQIGKLLGIVVTDSGDVDLDVFGVLPDIEIGKAVEIVSKE